MEGRLLLQTPAVITCSAAFHVTQRPASNIDDVAGGVGVDVVANASVRGRRTGEGSDTEGRDED